MTDIVHVHADLTPAEQSRLAELEGVVARGLQTFVEVGLALAEIRDQRLYRLTHPTFEDYCRERWGFTDRRARQLLEASKVGTVVPVANERQARELLPVLRDADERAVVEAWREAKATAEAHGKRITTKIIRNAVQRRVRRLEREIAAATPAEQPSLACESCGRRRGDEHGWSYLWSRNGPCVRGGHYCPDCATEQRHAANDAIDLEWHERRLAAERDEYARRLWDHMLLAGNAAEVLEAETQHLRARRYSRGEAGTLSFELAAAAATLKDVIATLREYAGIADA